MRFTPQQERTLELSRLNHEETIKQHAYQAEQRAAVNRANARWSTGPKSGEGKAVASLNAVKTGLTGRTVLLPSDDSAAYTAHIAAYESEYQPAGLRERELVQSLADTSWRLKRIPGLELALYARGRAEFAETFQHGDPALIAGKIELETYLKYEKQLKNLQLQEARLTRRYEKESAELRSLQKERRANEQNARKDEAAPLSEPKTQPGFVFSTPAAARAPSQSTTSNAPQPAKAQPHPGAGHSTAA